MQQKFKVTSNIQSEKLEPCPCAAKMY